MPESNATLGAVIGSVLTRRFRRDALVAAARVGPLLGLFLVAGKIISAWALGDPRALTAMELAAAFVTGVLLGIVLQVVRTRSASSSSIGTVATILVVLVGLAVGLRQARPITDQNVADAVIVAVGCLAVVVYLGLRSRDLPT